MELDWTVLLSKARQAAARSAARATASPVGRQHAVEAAMDKLSDCIVHGRLPDAPLAWVGVVARHAAARTSGKRASSVMPCCGSPSFTRDAVPHEPTEPLLAEDPLQAVLRRHGKVLTRRQRDAFDLLAAGRTIADIAILLHRDTPNVRRTLSSGAARLGRAVSAANRHRERELTNPSELAADLQFRHGSAALEAPATSLTAAFSGARSAAQPWLPGRRLR